MRLVLIGSIVLLAASASAEEKIAALTPAAGPIGVNIGYTINAPLLATTPESVTAEDRQYRKAMYGRAAGECEDLLASIASSCQITTINVSTQVNRYPGQPATIYVSTNVTMQIALK